MTAALVLAVLFLVSFGGFFLWEAWIIDRLDHVSDQLLVIRRILNAPKAHN